MALFCANCGNQLPDDSRFCLRCGTPVAGAAPTSGNTSPTMYTGTPTPPYQNTAYPPSAPQYPRGEYTQYPQHSQYPQQSPQGVFVPPNMQPAPVQRQKKSRLPLYLVAAIVVVVIVVSSVAYINYANQSTPDKTLSAFCNDLQSGNYADSYTLLSSKYQKFGTQAQWDTGLSTAFKAKGGISSCTTSNLSNNGSSSTGNMTISYGDRTNETDKVSMIQENGTWKVDNVVQLHTGRQ